MAEYFGPSDLPTVEEYITAFRTINMTENRLAVLRAQYDSPGHTARAADIAEDTGLLPHQTVNLVYGTLGRVLAKEMDYEPSKREIGTYRWWSVLSSGKSLGGGRFEWRMHPQVVEALERLGLVTISI